MKTDTVEVDTPDGPMALNEAIPDEPRAAVVVIQEAFGVNDYIEGVVRRLADEGYHAVAPHLFHRSGGGVIPYGDFAKVLPMFEPLTDDRILDDVDAALGHLRAAGWDDHAIGLVGFCFGGRVSFLTAARRTIGASVGFYGGGIVTARFPQFPALVGEATTLRTPWLGLFGDDDQSIPVEDVERLRDVLEEQAPVATHVVRYAGAGHGFHCDVRDSYQEQAASDGWTRAMAWFEQHLR